MKERDVLRFAGRAREGQRVEAARAHFGEEVAGLRQQRPVLAAQIAQVEAERLADLVVEDRLRAAERAGVDGVAGVGELRLAAAARTRTG